MSSVSHLVVDASSEYTLPTCDEASRQALQHSGFGSADELGRHKRCFALTVDATAVSLRQQLGKLSERSGDPCVAVAPRFRPIVRRWVDEVALHDVALRSAGSVGSATAAWDEVEVFAAQHGTVPALTRFFRECCKNLDGLLSGEVTVQEFLFAGGDDIARDIYAANPASVAINAATAALVADSVTTRRHRIMEVGAGTCATTSVVFDALSSHPLDYRVTDVSPWFFEQARDRFAGRAGVSYSLYDINSAALGDGEYDVVVAANVLHNGHRVTDMLRRLASTLRDDGRLVFIETGTEHLPLLASMRFLMDSSSFADETDTRRGTGRMFLTRQEWLGHLRRTGFRDVVSWPPAHHDLAMWDQFVISARPPSCSAVERL